LLSFLFVLAVVSGLGQRSGMSPELCETTAVLDLTALNGFTVVEIGLGSGVSLRLSASGDMSGSAQLAAGPVRYESPGGEAFEFEAEVRNATDYAPLLALLRQEIHSARVDEREKTVVLTFRGGHRLTALPMQDVEGWELRGPGELLLVAVPGGEVAVWGEL
jgi:hypothetical protein